MSRTIECAKLGAARAGLPCEELWLGGRRAAPLAPVPEAPHAR